LDYYTRTVFEFIKDDGQAVGGGGRYDGLVSQLGGAATCAVGFGMGMERLVRLLPETAARPFPALFIGHADAQGFAAACKLANDLRHAGIAAVTDLANRSVKAQMKYADKIKARCAVVLGATELEQNACTVKNMQTGELKPVALNEIATVI
jgi:histidyl-tRNA synthetase